MYAKYRDRVQFLLVYIREAHPTDGRQAPANVKENILHASPKTDAERDVLATVCVRKLDIHFPAVVDEIGDSTEKNYTAWPDRLYLVGRDGRIAWKGEPGPRGFRPPDLEKAIETELHK